MKAWREISVADLPLFIVTELNAKVEENWERSMEKRWFNELLQISWQMGWEKQRAMKFCGL